MEECWDLLSGGTDCAPESLDMKLCIVADIINLVKTHKSQKNVGGVFISHTPTECSAASRDLYLSEFFQLQQSTPMQTLESTNDYIRDNEFLTLARGLARSNDINTLTRAYAYYLVCAKLAGIKVADVLSKPSLKGHFVKPQHLTFILLDEISLVCLKLGRKDMALATVSAAFVLIDEKEIKDKLGVDKVEKLGVRLVDHLIATGSWEKATQQATSILVRYPNAMGLRKAPAAIEAGCFQAKLLQEKAEEVPSDDDES
jgi:hypothetical protein